MSNQNSAVSDEEIDTLDEAIKRFDTACQNYGWQSDQGTNDADITASAKEYVAAHSHLKVTIAGVIKGAMLNERERCAKSSAPQPETAVAAS